MDGSRPTATPQGDTAAAALGRLTLGLLAISVLAKLAVLPFPVETAGQFGRWLLRLAIVASADVAFVALLAAGAALTHWAVAQRWRRAWWIGVFAAYQLTGLYAVASVVMFRVTLRPLSVQLLSLAGGPVLMASSLAGFLTPGVLAGLAAVAVGLPLLVSWQPAFVRHEVRLRTPQPGLARFAMGTAALLLVTGYCAACQAYIQRAWTDPNRWERRIASSPHAALIASCWRQLSGADVAAALDRATADTSDFVDPSQAEVALAKTSAATAATSPRPKNVVLVVLESVGTQYLNLYGSPYETMPRMAALAAQSGLVFDNVYAHCPSSPQGLVALTCSTIPPCDWRLVTRDAPEFSVPSMAQALAGAGYQSAYLHSGFWGWKNRDRFLSERGADAVIDAAAVPAPQVFSWGVADRDLLAAGLRWIDQQAGQPFHLLLWTIETHHPYVVTEPRHSFGSTDEELERYLNALRSADAVIAELVRQLERRGLLDDTLIAVTGDHGEAFGQHGQRVHSFGVYEENVRVPLVLLHPSLAAGPRRSGALCQQVDIPAVLMGQLGRPQPAAWQGRDVLSHGGRERAYFFAVSNDVVLGVRQGDVKYHYHVQTGREELFDLASDPAEEHDLHAQRRQEAALLRRRLAGLVHAQRERLAAHGLR